MSELVDSVVERRSMCMHISFQHVNLLTSLANSCHAVDWHLPLLEKVGIAIALYVEAIVRHQDHGIYWIYRYPKWSIG